MKPGFEPHDGDTIAIVSMSGTCSCSIFVAGTKDFLSCAAAFLWSSVV